MTLPAAFTDRPVAHRGLHGAAGPENSRAAIEAAIAGNYGIEIDLQPSADGAAMVFHDYDMARLTGQSGVIRSRSAADLKQITLLGGAETIPSFRNILDLVAGRVPLLVEIKDQDGAMGPNLCGLEEAAAAEIAGYGGDLALMSFNPHSVKRLSTLCPKRPCGLVTCDFSAEHWPHLKAERRAELARIGDFESCGASFVSHDHRALEMPRIAALKAQGVPVLCWTIRSAAEEVAARRIADGITFEAYAA